MTNHTVLIARLTDTINAHRPLAAWLVVATLAIALLIEATTPVNTLGYFYGRYGVPSYGGW
jgi:hypothetical protein